MSFSSLRVFTLSALVFSLSPAAAQLQEGKVEPIVENPIPVWASSGDVCLSISSCDECQVSTEQYCRWNSDGKTSCCQKAKEDVKESSASVFDLFNSFFGGLWGNLNKDPSIEAGRVVPDQQSQQGLSGKVEPIASGEMEAESATVKPVTDAAEPESAAVKPQLTESEAESAAVTPIKAEAEAESAAVKPQVAESEPESAAVTPIMENPIPVWASSSDVCQASASCDECPLEGYCKYTEHDKPTCCVKSSAAGRSNENQLIQPVVVKLQEASIQPIVENPIPASASADCQRKRSCDMCSNVQSCKYTESGVPQCCTLQAQSGVVQPQTAKTEARSAATQPLNTRAEPESAAVKPIASQEAESAAVKPISSQEAESGAVKPNAGQQEPESGAVTPINGVAEPESASVQPIQNQIPRWASPSDICLEMPCDDCGAHQYCQFTKDGRQQCCGKISMTL